MEEEQNPGTTIENNKMKIPEEDASTFSCGEIQTDPHSTDVNEVEFTTGTQNDEHLDIKEVSLPVEATFASINGI